MSNKKTVKSRGGKPHPSQGKQERYIQPSILLGLLLKESYGYELIQNIQRFGFVEGQAPPGMIDRHLRQLEEDGLVASRWETEGVGPAKRCTRSPARGKRCSPIWASYMKAQSDKLKEFIDTYGQLEKGDKRRSR